MLKKILAFLILACVLNGFNVAKAETEKRIQFAKGKSSAVIKGVTGENGVSYVLRARSGQNLIFTLKPASQVGIKVEFDGKYGHAVLLREEKGGTYSVGLEENGDYTVFIGSTNHQSIPFILSVKTEKLADI